ncbi:anticodon-binding protein [Sphaerisporangium sp. NPDC049002]|uniref:anticodon-binding protein n=1 Tax=unclassified Sphaerisporangium TaxID=2630420 RepID=UPI0033D041EF
MRALGVVLGSPPVPQGSWERRAEYVSAVALRRADRAPREVAEELAVRLRPLAGVRAVDVRANGFLVIEVAVPGEIVREILAEPLSPPRGACEQGADEAGPWPDFPRTWDNPGFVVRYAYVRAGAVLRWARDLGLWGVEGRRTGARDDDLGYEHDDHGFTAGESAGAPDHGRLDDHALSEPEHDAEACKPAVFRPEALADPRDRAVLRVLAELPSRRESRDPGWQAYLERLAEAYHDAFEHAPALPKGDEAPTAAHGARLWMAAAVRRVIGEGLTELRQTAPHKI